MTPREQVRSKLDADLVQSLDELVEQTELDEDQVSAALRELKARNEARRVPDGWLATGFVAKNGEPRPIGMTPAAESAIEAGGCAPPIIAAAAPHVAQPDPETTMPRPKKTAKPAAAEPRQKRKYTRRKPLPERSTPVLAKAANGALSFALTEGREIAIERSEGGGERALISAADALRLADFIALVRPALEDAG